MASFQQRIFPAGVCVGISTCLVGEPIRYDGGHKRDDRLVDELSERVRLVPVCPEMELGLGAPREPMDLYGNPENPRLVTSTSGADLTEKMNIWSDARVGELRHEPVQGFVLKSKSPSCGLSSAKIYEPDGVRFQLGMGLFARRFMQTALWVPVAEESHLQSEAAVAAFLERVGTMVQYSADVDTASGVGAIVAFHSRHKYQLLAHNERVYRQMGPLVANAKTIIEKEGRASVVNAYRALLFEALNTPITVNAHVNTLQHIAGYFKQQLNETEKQKLQNAIHDFRRGTETLHAPLQLLQQNVEKFKNNYLAAQTYLYPYR
ncbi:MAG: DUF523 and DUF1722 domain-containing protein [Deltaproteobacteria bacterium]|nr:DUF523 and DUF1722 domain-containing protein [Deltaproteobacteria bacterium]MBN2674601.1 DUF523 and DUF1722 domain-containing protein [Deltaproteobacteria bacterium]